MKNSIINQFPLEVQRQFEQQLAASNDFYGLLQQDDRVTSEIYYIGDVKNIDDWVRYSLLFSDVTAISTVNSKKSLSILGIDTNQPVKIIDDKEIPGMKKEVTVLSGYAFITGDELTLLQDRYENIFGKEKIVIKPYIFEMRKIIAVNEERSLKALLTDPTIEYHNSLAGISNYDKRSILPISSLNDKTRSQFEIVIPYIKGVSLKDYANIITDEEDLLSVLRVKIKKAVNQILNEKITVNEFIQDEIRPNLDLLQTKFRRIKNLHKFKVAGTVVSFISLSLVAYATDGFLSALAQLSGVGLGTTGFIKSEVEYQEAVGNFKENPYYLLWKLKNIKKSF